MFPAEILKHISWSSCYEAMQGSKVHSLPENFWTKSTVWSHIVQTQKWNEISRSDLLVLNMKALQSIQFRKFPVESFQFETFKLKP